MPECLKMPGCSGLGLQSDSLVSIQHLIKPQEVCHSHFTTELCKSSVHFKLTGLFKLDLDAYSQRGGSICLFNLSPEEWDVIRETDTDRERLLTGHLSEAVSTARLVCHSCQFGRGSEETRWPLWFRAKDNTCVNGLTLRLLFTVLLCEVSYHFLRLK